MGTHIRNAGKSLSLSLLMPAGIQRELSDFCLLTEVCRVTQIKSGDTVSQTKSDTACIPVTQPFCQLTNTSEFMCQTCVQVMWAVGQGQTKGKYYILSTHCTAMQKREALEPVSKRACVLNLNHISELITDSNSKESQCNVVATENEDCCEVLMEPHL
jgi:hypothetical protein